MRVFQSDVFTIVAPPCGREVTSVVGCGCGIAVEGAQAVVNSVVTAGIVSYCRFVEHALVECTVIVEEGCVGPGIIHFVHIAEINFIAPIAINGVT